MSKNLPVYPSYTDNDVKGRLAYFVPLDNLDSYPFDDFHTHKYNELIVFIKGGGTHNINCIAHDIAHQSIHLLAANDVHWLERAPDSHGFAIVYKEQFLHKLEALNPDIAFNDIFGSSRVINLDEAQAENFKLIFSELIACKAQTVYMLHLIGAFITKIATAQFDWSLGEKTFDAIMPDLLQLIEQKYKMHYRLKDYAALLHVSPRTLQNKIKQSSHKSLFELQQERLLKEAKRLLCTSGMGVGEVSMELGFKDVPHFSNWFRKLTSVHPSSYNN